MSSGSTWKVSAHSAQTGTNFLERLNLAEKPFNETLLIGEFPIEPEHSSVVLDILSLFC
jgi:hypothetical protein